MQHKNSIGIFKKTLLVATVVALMAASERACNILALLWTTFMLFLVFQAAVKEGDSE